MIATKKLLSVLFTGALAASASAADLAGNPRVAFGKIDVGCFECQRKLGFSVVIR